MSLHHAPEPKRLNFPVLPKTELEGEVILPAREKQQAPNPHDHHTLIDLIETGQGEKALYIARDTFNTLVESKGATDELTLYALSNLMHCSVCTGSAKMVSEAEIHTLADQILPPSSELGDYRLHVLSRLTQYSAHFGGRMFEIREVALEGLEVLHQCYPLMNATEDLRRFSAAVLITAAAEIILWMQSEDRPDYRGIDYIAKCGRDRLNEFDPMEGSLNYGLYLMRRGKTDQALEEFVPLMRESASGTKIKIASCEAALKAYIALEDSQNIRECFEQFAKSISETHTLSATERDRLVTRIRGYEKHLNS